MGIYKDEYMDFGYWSLYPVSGTGGYTIQFFAAGYETPSMPAAGSASYNGLAVGSAYSNLDASGALTSADVSATANFSSRTFSINSSAPAIFTLDGVFIGYENGLGFSGAGAISGSAVSGTATLVRGDSGAFSAKFYGPSANHVGGTFGFTGGRVLRWFVRRFQIV